MGLTLIFIRESKTSKYFLNADINIITDTFGFMIMQPPIEVNHENNTITFYIEHENFGYYMQVLREHLNWKQTFLAEKAGLTSQYISQVENGKKFPKDSTLLKIVEAMFTDQSIKYINPYTSTTSKTIDTIKTTSDEEKKETLDAITILELQSLQLSLNSIVDTDDLHLLALVNETMSCYRAFYNCLSDNDRATADDLIEIIVNKVRTGLERVRDEHN